MNIMFICTGNICRSAMAHGLLEKRLKDLKKDEQIKVFSCGVYAENGADATYNSIEAIKKYDVDLRNHKSTNIRNSNIQNMDLILCATNAHKEEVIYLYPDLADKVFTLKENGNINDPYGYDMDIYINCAKEIAKCIEILLDKILK